jgi:hypothetical protein
MTLIAVLDRRKTKQYLQIVLIAFGLLEISDAKELTAQIQQLL